jgi:hypothetical protein
MNIKCFVVVIIIIIIIIILKKKRKIREGRRRIMNYIIGSNYMEHS